HCTVISTSLPWIHGLGSAKEARKGPLALWHKVNADGPFRPSGSWRGQRSGVGPYFRDAGPGSKAKPAARRSGVRRTGRLRWGARKWVAPSVTFRLCIGLGSEIHNDLFAALQTLQPIAAPA